MKQLKKITPKRIETWDPCGGWTIEGIRDIFRRHNLRSATPLQIARCKDVSVEDRLWVLLREEIIPPRELRLLACKWATRALLAERKAGREPDERLWNAVKIARRYAAGKATREELAAAWAAAWAAAAAVAEAVAPAAVAAAVAEAVAAASAAEAAVVACRAARAVQFRDVISVLKTLE